MKTLYVFLMRWLMALVDGLDFKQLEFIRAVSNATSQAANEIKEEPLQVAERHCAHDESRST